MRMKMQTKMSVKEWWTSSSGMVWLSGWRSGGLVLSVCKCMYYEIEAYQYYSGCTLYCTLDTAYSVPAIHPWMAFILFILFIFYFSNALILFFLLSSFFLLLTDYSVQSIKSINTLLHSPTPTILEAGVGPDPVTCALPECNVSQPTQPQPSLHGRLRSLKPHAASRVS